MLVPGMSYVCWNVLSVFGIAIYIYIYVYIYIYICSSQDKPAGLTSYEHLGVWLCLLFIRYNVASYMYF